MDIESDALRAVVREAPHAVVMGYSHRPGDRGTTANAWILCERGRLAQGSPSGNVGNGVDGPVLRWAASLRRADEPFVWVTDGQVTDSHDYPDANLTRQCAELVRRHRIRLVRDLGDVLGVVRANRPNSSAELSSFGRVGHVLRESLET
jgi:hypothetical protein